MRDNMGDVIRFAPRAAAREERGFPDSCVADRAAADLPLLAVQIASVIGRSGEINERNMPKIDFVDALPGEDHPDGTVFPFRGEPSAPVIMCTVNVADFFRNNGIESRSDAIGVAALYSAALGFSVITLSMRAAALHVNKPIDALWTKLNLPERSNIPYRYAAGVVNEVIGVFNPREINVRGKVLTRHAASFVDPLDKKALREVSTSYFRAL